jgi:hypothetical protein
LPLDFTHLPTIATENNLRLPDAITITHGPPPIGRRASRGCSCASGTISTS